jgi:sugar phosphate isomerase/epimerase
MAWEIGAASWVFGSHDLDDICSRAARLGFSGLELMIAGEELNAKSLASKLAAHDLRPLSLTPENVDLASSVPLRRRQAVDYYCELLRFARSLGCPLVTCHEAIRAGDGTVRETGQWRHLADSCTTLAKFAETMKVGVGFEALGRGMVQWIDDIPSLMKLVRAVGSPHFGIVLDTYHLTRHRHWPPRGLREAAPHLFAVQLADSGRLGLGLGNNPIRAQLRSLRQIRYRGPLVVECSPELRAPSPIPRAIRCQRVEQHLATSLELIQRFEHEGGRAA